MKYNKVRGILRAKQGSQVPKFLMPHGPITNNNNIGSTLPIPMYANLLLDETLGKSTSPTPKYSSLTGMEYLRPRSEQQAALTNNLMSKGVDVGNLIKATVENNKQNKFGQGLNKLGKGINKGIGQYGDHIGTGLTLAGNALFGLTEDSGTYQTVDNVLGMASNIPVVGKYATALKGALNFVNGLGASTIDATGLDSSTIEKSGGSYGGTITLNNLVQSDRDKKFGLFNRGGYKAALGRANKLLSLKATLENIISENEDYQSMVNDLNHTKFNILQNGGYQLFLRAAKQGGTLTQKINLIKSRKFNQVINVDTKLVEEFKDGGVFPSHVDNSSINYPVYELAWEPEIELFEEWEPVIELEIFQEGGPIKKSFEEWFTSIPKDSRASGYDYKKAYEVLDWETLHNHTKDPEKYHLYSVSPIADDNGNYPFLKLGKIENNPEIQGEFDWYNSKEGAEHKSKFDILFINDRYYYVPKKFKDGGKAKEELETPEIEETNQKNLIPEGALHKNKHHMEHTEGLTQKGIPVIDNDGEQLAEIELDEIIFTLEVTKKLEELYKEGTDEAAIEAGKLLVKEILFNTDDRTGLISKCEKGGKINEIN